ncbi:MAG: ATP-binding cassette domain-containing protein [Eubacteriales bacterium]
MPVIRLESVYRTYKQHDAVKNALENVSLEIKQGEFVFVVGASGSGKSTLLKLMSGVIPPSHGSVFIDEMKFSKKIDFRKNKLRRNFGHVWQDSQLMRRRTIGDNLAIVARAGGNVHQIPEAVTKALGLVGMPKVEDKFPGELSIGEARRVELARAIINSPNILLVDEITANLDDENIWDLLELLKELNRRGTTVIMVTHAGNYVSMMRRRVMTMVDGRLIGDVPNGRYGDIIAPKTHGKEAPRIII